jgi:hypothetical protein
MQAVQSTADGRRNYLRSNKVRPLNKTFALEGNYLSVDDDFFRGDGSRLRATVQHVNSK